jgi:hypothetical protein
VEGAKIAKISYPIDVGVALTPGTRGGHVFVKDKL